jgi:hypothetical protein
VQLRISLHNCSDFFQWLRPFFSSFNLIYNQMARIFETPDTLEADFLVFLTPNETEADLLIFEDEMGESRRLQDWVYVDEPEEAQYIVGYADEEDEADIKIFFVDDPEEAKLLNETKRRFF